MHYKTVKFVFNNKNCSIAHYYQSYYDRVSEPCKSTFLINLLKTFIFEHHDDLMYLFIIMMMIHIYRLLYKIWSMK